MLRLHEFRYQRPTSLDAAAGLLREHDGDVMPIAGGTDLMPNMKHRLFTPGHDRRARSSRSSTSRGSARCVPPRPIAAGASRRVR
jgi:hypothetical protein